MPEDGEGFYEESFSQLFPSKVREVMWNSHEDGTVDKLTKEVEKQARNYFHINEDIEIVYE